MSDPALLLVGHGSRRPGHAETIRRIAAGVAARVGEVPVRSAFLELSEPSVGDALDSLAADGARDLVVVPLLLGEAYHSSVDLPRQLRRALRRHPGVRAHQAPVLGPHPLLDATAHRRLLECGVLPAQPATGVVLAAAGSSDPAAVATV
ncbi:MAG: CbiX/SirB N-terminal domain-containing protein, partial [Actinomycetota bacterium]|nr:CbiX/SirB N-terminal domain-containing protein [Actinomycetota bacterium]